MTKQQVRCAVYTRKSSEEGLEQSFNSLEAQREACMAYINSQKHEGWIAADGRYDDGGFSGGTMERPPSADQILDKYIEALGGAQQLAKLSSFTAKGTYEGYDTGWSSRRPMNFAAASDSPTSLPA
jgi:hypothetical protein